MTSAAATLERVVREEWGRILALLLARYRRLDLVEDALADAVAAAATHWPTSGVPDNPAAWLNTAAQRRTLDRLRAEAMALRRMPLLISEVRSQPQEAVMADPGGLVEDDLLRLVLMCAHPALATDAASALSLRLVLGLPTSDIARLFLVGEPTMAARITRAKKKIVTAGIPFAIPGVEALPDRLDLVARTAYLAFTAGYAPGSGPDLLRAELAGEAIRLARVAHQLRPGDSFAFLIALMSLQHSRRDARVSPAGQLVLLPDQDRNLWHRDEIDAALTLLWQTDPLRPRSSPFAESYRLQALIAAEHARALFAANTRWDRIDGLYAALEQVNPSPAVTLARAVAVAEDRGPSAGLALLADLEMPGHRLPAVRAELLQRAGRSADAVAALELAIALCGNEVERQFLIERRAELGDLSEPSAEG